MMIEPVKEYVEYDFVYESVSIDAIAGYAYSSALADKPRLHNNTAWFHAWATSKIRHQFDIAQSSTIHFLRFDVYPATAPDGFYFVVEGKWQYWSVRKSTENERWVGRSRPSDRAYEDRVHKNMNASKW